MTLRLYTLGQAGIALALTTLPIVAAYVSTDSGYRLLFQRASGSLPEADQRAIYAGPASGLRAGCPPSRA